MARTGKQFASISGSYSTYNYGTWELRSQNKEELTSTIRIRSYFTYTGGETVASSYSTFKINNSTIKTGSYSRIKGDYLLGYKDITVKHNEDGSFPNTKISIYASSAHFDATTKSYTLTSSNIPSIEVKSLITSLTPTLFSEQKEAYEGINLNLSLLSGYKTSLSAEINGSTYDVIDNITSENIELLLAPNSQPTTDNQYVFPLTSDDLFALMTGITDLNIKFILKTYDNDTLIGTDEEIYIFTITGSGFEFKTVGSCDEKTLSLTGNSKRFIQDNSTMTITVNILNNYNNDSVQKYRFYKRSEGITTFYESDSPVFTYPDTIKLDDEYWVYILSNRNYFAHEDEGYIYDGDGDYVFIPYAKPLIENVKINRAEQLATYLNFIFSGFFDNQNFGAIQNNVILSYRYKKSSSNDYTNWINIIATVDDNGKITYDGQLGSQNSPIVPTNESAIFEVRIEDLINYDTISNISIFKSKSMFDWGEIYFNFNGDFCINDKQVPCFEEVESNSTSKVVKLYDYEMNPLILEKNILTCGLSNDISVKGSDDTYRAIPVVETTKIGNLLKVVDGEIIIPTGVSNVLVSANIYFSNDNNSSEMTLVGYIEQNDNKNYISRGCVRIPAGQSSSVSLPQRLIEVQEGDVLRISSYKGISSGLFTVQSGDRTWFTVEVVG